MTYLNSQLTKTHTIGGIKDVLIMKYIFIALGFLLGASNESICQTLSGTYLHNYKYFVLDPTSSLLTKNIIRTELSQLGYPVVNLEDSFPEDLLMNSDLAMYISLNADCGSKFCTATVELKKTGNESVWKSDKYTGETIDAAIKRALKPFSFYKYGSYVPKTARQAAGVNFKSEQSIKKYLDNEAELEPIEGIWIFSGTIGNYSRGAIVKNLNGGYTEVFLENLISNATEYKRLEIVGTVKKMPSKGFYMFNEKKGGSYTAVLKGDFLEVYYSNSNVTAIREYPMGNNFIQKKVKNGEWAGNGSGIIISKSGYIITNHHVIDDVDDIEVEFIIDGEVKKFNAEIVQTDKVNDLAIIKIVDVNFDGLDDLPYNFKTPSSDVGTKVYAYGYPMALSLMGKEIKITDGIISSKSGFDGDITTYQITAPIQGGNSGGPLFDDKGNFIGINSSGLRKDIADNVAYSIKSSYVANLIDVLPKKIDLPESTKLQLLPLTEQIKEISKYVVLVKIK